MAKYYASLVTALKSDTTYVLSVLAWRVRNVLRVLVIYVLWLSILSFYPAFSGYSTDSILTYILLAMMVQAVVFSSRTIDVSNDISSGDFSNILLKPIDYFKYYLAQDTGNKFMNFSFSFFEFLAFLYIFKPPLFIQTSGNLVILFFICLIISTFIYYYANMIFSLLAF